MPSPTSVRELALAAFATQLAKINDLTAGNSVTVKRNVDDVLSGAELPAVVMEDGGQSRHTGSSGDGESFGSDTYTARVRVFGYLDAVDDAALGAGISDLYARIVKTMLADRYLGSAVQYIQEGADAMDDPDQDHTKGRRPNASFYVNFDVEFVTVAGDPYTAAG